MSQRFISSLSGNAQAYRKIVTRSHLFYGICENIARLSLLGKFRFCTYIRNTPSVKRLLDDATVVPFEPSRERQPVDPRLRNVFLFPGRVEDKLVSFTNHAVKELENVRCMYDAASSILGYDLLERSADSREMTSSSELRDASVFVSSLAYVEKLSEVRPFALEDCVVAAGYGVGEITALTFATAISFEDAITLIKIRSEAVDLCNALVSGAAAEVRCLPDNRIQLLCRTALKACEAEGVQDPFCSVSAFLGPSHYILAGSPKALTFIREHQKDMRLFMFKQLSNTGAVHTRAMLPTKEIISKALQNIELNKPRMKVMSTSLHYYLTEENVKDYLPNQLCEPVKWQQLMGCLYDRANRLNVFPITYVCGTNRGTLYNWLKEINLKASRNVVTEL